MKSIIIFIICLSANSILISQESQKEIQIRYIRPDGSEYVKYVGEQFYKVVIPSDNPNYLLSGDNAPDKNLYFDEGIIVIEYNSILPLLGTPQELVNNIDMSVANDPELNSFHVFPNPTSQQTSISFSLKAEKNVQIDLFTYDGKFIQTITNSHLQSGEHILPLDTFKEKSGTYMLTFVVDDKKISKLVYLK